MYLQSESDQVDKEKFLKLAIQYHHSHLVIADKPGQFVAHCNLGLTYSKLGRFKEAKDHHKQAVRCSLELQSAHGQSLALGNLALVEQRSGDVAAASECMSQHLDLVKMLGMYCVHPIYIYICMHIPSLFSSSLYHLASNNLLKFHFYIGDKTAQSVAMQELGKLANSKGDFVIANNYFSSSRNLIRSRHGSRSQTLSSSSTLAKAAKVQIGISLGNAKMQEQVSKMASRYT